MLKQKLGKSYMTNGLPVDLLLYFDAENALVRRGNPAHRVLRACEARHASGAHNVSLALPTHLGLGEVSPQRALEAPVASATMK